MATLASRDPDPLHLPEDAVLLTIDMQVGFDQFTGRSNPACEANVRALQDAWRKAGRPLWHVRHDSVEPKSVFRPGQPGNAHKPETAPAAGEPVIAKSAHSAFIGTDLDRRLRALASPTGHGTSVPALVLCGIQTNFCVASTARMAGNMGYRTFVVGDACATFPQPLLDGRVVDAQLAHDLALAELHGEFATVVQTADVVRAARP